MAEENKVSASTKVVVVQLKGSLSTRDYVFFIIWKFMGPNKYKPVYKSEIKQQERGHQNWNEFKIDTALLCNDDPNQEIKVDFFRYDHAGSHKLIASDYTELQ
mmetsp:Transcript_980/g.1756  ORF Transcript_980/g.1756 Transcript_980/m.1756 type:complete len:103 (+) Transcript_980:558-866(+)